jgi:hypothetical protein
LLLPFLVFVNFAKADDPAPFNLTEIIAGIPPCAVSSLTHRVEIGSPWFGCNIFHHHHDVIIFAEILNPGIVTMHNYRPFVF